MTKIDEKLSALQLIADEIKLEIKRYGEKRRIFIDLASDAAEISRKAGRFSEMKLKIDYWQ